MVISKYFITYWLDKSLEFKLCRRRISIFKCDFAFISQHTIKVALETWNTMINENESILGIIYIFPFLFLAILTVNKLRMVC